jgi:hypothetical protein
MGATIIWTIKELTLETQVKGNLQDNFNLQSHYSFFRTNSNIDGIVLINESKPKKNEDPKSSINIVLIAPVPVYNKLFGK